jgi:carboxymethylenebutenolidase
MGDYIQIPTSGGTFSAYLARPPLSAQRFPMVVVIQEIFGINQDMRETCDELAAQGYGALCPDMFWRMEPGVELSSFNEAEWHRGLALYQAFDIDQGVEDIATTVALARQLPGASGKVGVMGFCLGGLMTFLTAARRGADAAVAYYGGGTERYVDEGRQLAAPLMMHLAEEDEFISKAAQGTIREALSSHPMVKICSYPGRQHAFARHGGAHFDADAAQLANARTATFLRLHLKS